MPSPKIIRQLMATFLVALCGATGAKVVIAAPNPEETSPVRAPSLIIAGAPDTDWRAVRPENLLILELPSGPVTIELAEQFAPGHVANVRKLVTQGFYDNLAMYRVIDGFVAQGGDQSGQRETGKAKRTIPAEFTTGAIAADKFNPIPGPDGYAEETGFSGGFPAARDPASGKTWMVHCYGSVAMAREEGADSGGTDFYIVIGSAQRYLDRNTTVFGRVISGMEAVQQLARGNGPGGLLAEPAVNRIASARLASQLPAAERPAAQVMRTDSASFAELVRSRRNRPESWFRYRPDHTDVCAIGVPVRFSGN
ncbi:peptidylprolyl isomerase [Microbulbifer guangxiensis]|uniref:peptidylprolyl isomerase n=1 Tax=Microbulbifer guangxiensis TaxID=2904249 RepID=UPI001F18FEF7|nr:peptidylprolyl isomerase [Microbulbifer guangxiensis]